MEIIQIYFLQNTRIIQIKVNNDYVYRITKNNNYKQNLDNNS
jgi:hypothetical protein